MASKLVYHIGDIKVSRKENALGKVFAWGLPFVTTISKMIWSDKYDISERHFKTADKHRNRENDSKAIKYYKKAIEACPENAQAHLHLGEIYLEKKKYAEAAKHYFRLVEIGKKRQPESETARDADKAKAILAEGYDGLGKAFWGAGEYDTAVAMLEKSLETHQSITRKLVLYGFLQDYYTEIGNNEKAQQCAAALCLHE